MLILKINVDETEVQRVLEALADFEIVSVDFEKNSTLSNEIVNSVRDAVTRSGRWKD